MQIAEAACNAQSPVVADQVGLRRARHTPAPPAGTTRNLSYRKDDRATVRYALHMSALKILVSVRLSVCDVGGSGYLGN